jgi:hypothetical protein
MVYRKDLIPFFGLQTIHYARPGVEPGAAAGPYLD